MLLLRNQDGKWYWERQWDWHYSQSFDTLANAKKARKCGLLIWTSVI